MAVTDFENINILPDSLNVQSAPSNLPDVGLPTDSQMVNAPLPPNTNGGNVANSIDAATLGNFNPNGQQGPPQSDISFVNRVIDPLSGEPVALDDATNELFMPGMNKSIRVGGTSGQLTGGRDIFVAQGGLTPFAALERKKAAQQKAALERDKKLNQFKRATPKLAENKFFNDNVLKKYHQTDEDFIERAKKEFGAGWQVALTSPETKIGREYANELDNLNTLVEQADQVTGLVAEVEKSIEKGDQFVSDGTMELKRKYDQLVGDFSQKGGNIGGANLKDLVDKLQTSANLDTYIKENNILDNIDAVILQTAGIDDSRADQYRSTTRYTEDFSKAVAAAAKETKNNPAFRNREDLTEADIAGYFGNLKGKTDKRTASVQSKPKADGFTDKSQVPVSTQPKVIGVGKTQFQTSVSVPYSEKSQSKPVQVTGIIAIDENGNPVTRTGQTKFRPVENSVITTSDGLKRRVVSGKEIINVEGLSNREKAELGISPKSKQKTIERDIIVDYDNIEGTIKGISTDARASAEAFSDVSQDSKRDKMHISNDNFSDDFEKAFIQSGFTDPDDFIKAAAGQGIDVVLNEESLKKKNLLKDPLSQ